MTTIKLEWKRVVNCGLEAYVVMVDGKVMHQFFSEQSAITCFQRLKRKLELGK